MIKRRLRQAGLPEHYSAHSFRAAGVTNFPENGGSLEVAQGIVGHADSRTTNFTTGAMRSCSSRTWSGFGIKLRFHNKGSNPVRVAIRK